MEKIDIYTFEEHLDDFLDENALHFPARQDIVIKHFFSPEGVYGRVYWNRKEWAAAEQPVWEFRMKYGISRESKAGKFCNGFYKHNTLIMPKQKYEDSETVYISNASVRSDGVSQCLELLKEAGVQWLQLSEAVLEILLAYGDAAMPGGMGISYIEVLNSKNTDICQKAEQVFGCPVAGVWMSPLFGYYAYAEHLSDKPSLIEGQITIDKDDGQTLVSGQKNSVMPLKYYNTDLWAAGAVSGNICIGDIRLPKEVLYFPVEMIDEKTGRIVLQMEAAMDEEGKVLIHFGIRPTYWNWREELEHMYRQYLEELLYFPVEIVYTHTKGWLQGREDI